MGSKDDCAINVAVNDPVNDLLTARQLQLRSDGNLENTLTGLSANCRYSKIEPAAGINYFWWWQYHQRDASFNIGLAAKDQIAAFPAVDLQRCLLL
ncbi:MAG: hypothetical protein ACD_39C00903G0003 [uncultured bacterium]|nr:MAG: hypothetical protein ACD_39C00903G0003 [uncultured bacterium]